MGAYEGVMSIAAMMLMIKIIMVLGVIIAIAGVVAMYKFGGKQ